MTLDITAKEKLRNEIKLMLAPIDNPKTKLQLDSELLNTLLFDEEKFIDENKVERVAKFVVWSGDFLSKIDLSNANFDNVLWDVEKNEINSIKTPYYKVSEINLSNTNAHINFYNAFLIDDTLTVNGCSFENVDLSKSYADKIKYSANSNFKNTNANLKLKFTNMKNLNLENVDLSNYEVDAYEPDNIEKLRNLNVKNTGIKIYYDIKKQQELKDAGMVYDRPKLEMLEREMWKAQTLMHSELKKYFTNNKKRCFQINKLYLEELEENKKIYSKIENEYDTLKEYMNITDCERELEGLLLLNKLDGCYVNGKLIGSTKDDDYANEVLEGIKQKINSLK